ncbi:beta-ketoacyl-ACP synthase II [Vibrio sp. C8]
MMNNNRIVVTGMGIVSPLGIGVDSVWNKLINSESGIRNLPDELRHISATKVGGLVPDITSQSNGLDESRIVSTKESKKIDRFILYALAAAQEALNQANWHPVTEQDCISTGTIIATGIGGLPFMTKAQAAIFTSGVKKISPFTIPGFLANLAAGNVSIRYGFKGPIGTPVTACAAGIQAIGDAMRIIRTGEADVVLAGGAEACIDPLSLGGFNALKALSTYADEPAKASRPFDANRNGFVMGEGAGLMVLESLEHALNRGAVPLVEIAGYGTSADAHHITSGPESGEGAARAMVQAMSMAKITANDIGYVNAHATATPVGDRAEIAALRKVFQECISNVSISSTKSATGHLLGAAGGVESIFTAQAIRTGILPPTLNLEKVEVEMSDLDLIPLTSKSRTVDYALCNGFGFGGVNAAVVLKRYIP